MTEDLVVVDVVDGMLNGKEVVAVVVVDGVWFGVAEIEGFEKPSDKRCHSACWGSNDDT